LVIFRTFGLASSMPLLILGTVGALLTPLGWDLAESLFLDQPMQTATGHGHFAPPNDGRFPQSVKDIVFTAPDVVQPIYHRFVDPVVHLLSTRVTVQQAAYYVFGLLWMLLVWSFLGGAITRIAAVRLGREERTGLRDALRYAARRLVAYITSPLFPLAGVVSVAVPIFLLGLLMQMDWGVLVAGILWIFVLLGGLIIAILMTGLLFGWPLMWATVSSEETGDAFEAFSRSYSYTFGRPLHYLFYAVLAVFFGGLSWLLVHNFAEAVIYFCDWPAALGAGADRWDEVLRARQNPSLGDDVVAWGVILMNGCTSLVRSVATGFGYSLFWCLATAIYLLLRHDVDQTEFDEVYVEHEAKRYELPAMTPLSQPSAPLGETPSGESAAGPNT
jgi:hypothetical protein